MPGREQLNTTTKRRMRRAIAAMMMVANNAVSVRVADMIFVKELMKRGLKGQSERGGLEGKLYSRRGEE
jgi:hypothetical protein